ncbi:MAG: DUF3565 domain-containing protein [Gammaproteobacteria bacterium]|nr:DUF3565 domain-containing protein [Gammaproteobacteria bacterium]
MKKSHWVYKQACDHSQHVQLNPPMVVGFGR